VLLNQIARATVLNLMILNYSAR